MRDAPVAQRRRRGKRLEAAILDAAWQELTDHGWAGLRMEAVASRAGTGKTSVYTRWPSKAHLVRAAAERAAATRGAQDSVGDLSGDLRRVLDRAAAALDGPLGEALRGMVAEARVIAASEAPSPLFSDEEPVKSVVDLIAAAERRGEIEAGARLPGAVNLGLTLITHHYLVTGARPETATSERFLKLWLAALRAAPE